MLVLGGLGSVGAQGRGLGQAQPPAYQLLPRQECAPRKPLSPLHPSTYRVKEVYRLEEMEKIFVR